MIKKTYSNQKSFINLQASLVCQTTYVPVSDSQRSMLEESIGYSEHILLPNPSDLLKEELQRDRLFLKNQKKKLDKEKMMKEKAQNIMDMQDSTNQFLVVRKVSQIQKTKKKQEKKVEVRQKWAQKEIGKQKLRQKEEEKPTPKIGKWGKPKVVNNGNFNMIATKKENEKWKNMETIQDGQDCIVEDVKIENNTFHEIQKVVNEDNRQEIEVEESLLISKSRYDMPNAFVVQKETLSEYVQSVDKHQWEEMESSLRNKQGCYQKNNQQDNGIVEMVTAIKEEENQQQQDYEQQEQQEEQQQYEAEQQQQEQQQQQQSEEQQEQQQDQQEEDQEQESQQEEEDDQQEQQQQQQDEQQQQQEYQQQQEEQVQQQEIQQKDIDKIKIKNKNKYVESQNKSMIDVFVVEIITKPDSDKIINTTDADKSKHYQKEYIEDQQLREDQSQLQASENASSVKQENQWKMAQKTISDLKSLLLL